MFYIIKKIAIFFKRLGINKNPKNPKKNIEEYFIKDENIDLYSCDDCKFKRICKVNEPNKMCFGVGLFDLDFDDNKESILLIDDNAGLISILEDDLIELSKSKVMNLNDYNLIKISGAMAGFTHKVMEEKSLGLNIKYAIIDITLGGSMVLDGKSVKYTGIDVYERLIDKNSDLRFIFYTGNNLNPYIRSNKRILEQFKKLRGDLLDYTLFKTSFDMKDRREYISKKLFNKSYLNENEKTKKTK